MVTVEQVTDGINYIVTYGPVVWTFVSSVIAAASLMAAHLPTATPGTLWYSIKTVLNVLASNVHNARVVHQNPEVK